MKIVSACLAGIGCRYDGEAKPCPAVMQLVAAGQAIPLCPEQMGGQTTPRLPAERVGERVLRKDGADVTAEFIRGAGEAMKLVELSGADGVILKAKSPSCGCGRIYDGTFSGTVIPGDGVFAELCRARGLKLETEDDYV
jgi:uncharacterized protein YbbK (DUF523 family)